MHRRLMISHPNRAATRPPVRSALRPSLRRIPHRVPRRLFKDNGPTLDDICNIISLYLKLSEEYDKKWHPPSRFKTLAPPEEVARRFYEDLDRIYGDHAAH